MVFLDISSHIFTIITLSLFILIGNPLIVMILMGIFGYTRSTGFMAGLTVSPTPSLSIRFLGVPNYIDTYAGSELSDFQLWISVSVRP